jgi:hypothetical protein
MHPKTDGLLESSLYVQDVAASARFYMRIFGFRMIIDFGERGCAMQAGERQVLLLFKRVAPSVSLRRTMEMASCTSPLRFRLPS